MFQSVIPSPARLATRLALAISSLSFFVVGCSDEAPVAEEQIRPVVVHEVTPGSATQQRTFPARARAGTESDLSFKVGGQIREILVEAGEVVRKDQVLARLDDADLTLELRRAEAGYAEANAQARNAAADYERTKKLHDADATSDNALESAETTAASTRAGLQAQAQAVALARAQLAYTELRSPADGVIASVPGNVNENVQIGEPVVHLNAGGFPEVTFTIPEQLIGLVERGQATTVQITTLPDTVFQAEIIEIGVSDGRTAFPVTARLLEGDERIRSGMVAEATVQFARAERSGPPRPFIPAYSVAEDAEGRFVYVARLDGDAYTVERRAVRIGELTVEGLEIEDGLVPGDRVLTAGIRFVQDGQRVKLLER